MWVCGCVCVYVCVCVCVCVRVCGCVPVGCWTGVIKHMAVVLQELGGQHGNMVCVCVCMCVCCVLMCASPGFPSLG